MSHERRLNAGTVGGARLCDPVLRARGITKKPSLPNVRTNLAERLRHRSVSVLSAIRMLERQARLADAQEGKEPHEHETHTDAGGLSEVPMHKLFSSISRNPLSELNARRGDHSECQVQLEPAKGRSSIVVGGVRLTDRLVTSRAMWSARKQTILERESMSKEEEFSRRLTERMNHRMDGAKIMRARQHYKKVHYRTVLRYWIGYVESENMRKTLRSDLVHDRSLMRRVILGMRRHPDSSGLDFMRNRSTERSQRTIIRTWQRFVSDRVSRTESDTRRFVIVRTAQGPFEGWRRYGKELELRAEVHIRQQILGSVVKYWRVEYPVIVEIERRTDAIRERLRKSVGL